MMDFHNKSKPLNTPGSPGVSTEPQWRPARFRWRVHALNLDFKVNLDKRARRSAAAAFEFLLNFPGPTFLLFQASRVWSPGQSTAGPPPPGGHATVEWSSVISRTRRTLCWCAGTSCSAPRGFRCEGQNTWEETPDQISQMQSMLQWELRSDESRRASENHRLNNLVTGKFYLNMKITQKIKSPLHYYIKTLSSDKSDETNIQHVQITAFISLFPSQTVTAVTCDESHLEYLLKTNKKMICQLSAPMAWWCPTSVWKSEGDAVMQKARQTAS